MSGVFQKASAKYVPNGQPIKYPKPPTKERQELHSFDRYMSREVESTYKVKLSQTNLGKNRQRKNNDLRLLAEFEEGNPVCIRCMYCQEYVRTVVIYSSDNGKHKMRIFLFCTLGLCCIWLPVLLDTDVDITHKCPNCHNVIQKLPSE